ncbi:MAG: DNA methyltransferase [Propionibacteriaceae bacterium]|nr:DNA methyltransferase [Propionibacteriaceae bacterium]
MNLVRLRPVIFVEHDTVLAERHPAADEDVHFARWLVEAVLEDLTQPGDRVLDPFAGFGTTLQVAESMGRHAVGVELLPERCAAATAVAPESTVIQGDARELAQLVSGPFDLILTSPPYMASDDGSEDPLAGYTGASSYEAYLADLRLIFGQCVELLAPSGHLVVNVANIDTGNHFTPLAWDIGRILGELGRLTQDVFVCWDRSWHDLAGDYVLVVRPRCNSQR